MSDNYEPGTVAVATVRGKLWAFRYDPTAARPWVIDCVAWRDGQSNYDAADLEGFRVVARPDRPLIVLDPAAIDTRPQDTVPYLLRVLREAEQTSGYSATLRQLADQIEAQIKPPMPEEPTGLGAVVEACFETSEGNGFGPATWVKAGDGSWVCITDGHVGTAVPWPFLTRVEVKP